MRCNNIDARIVRRNMMALSKLQNLVQKLSESQNVKKVVADFQVLSQDIQSKIGSLSNNDALKTYKEVLQKINTAESDLQKEVNKVISKIKQSASDVEKNLDLYKKKALAQKSKIEKMLKKSSGTTASKKTASVKTKKAAPKKATKRKAAKKSKTK